MLNEIIDFVLNAAPELKGLVCVMKFKIKNIYFNKQIFNYIFITKLNFTNKCTGAKELNISVCNSFTTSFNSFEMKNYYLERVVFDPQ